jgi:hypothetical protein
MVRDKAKDAVEMRQRMMNLRSGEVVQQASTMAPSSGSGGGRTGGGVGRGGGSSNNRTTKKTDLNEENQQLAVTTMEPESTKLSKTDTLVSSDETPTVSDLTEDTTVAPQEMDTDEDILAPVSLSDCKAHPKHPMDQRLVERPTK